LGRWQWGAGIPQHIGQIQINMAVCRAETPDPALANANILEFYEIPEWFKLCCAILLQRLERPRQLVELCG
jgi:hypothetical protein